ncbi:uncharacterized protein Dana_GF21635 [Drosophila ananassae]|uniref:Ubiquitin-like domain-containing protein n=1 Tax=Drosophila ananassae TaxID=7217 RepID=B3MVB7_DROAN|nr:uncharacterized protein LOC6504308 [Drosophila ananassae]EDV33182.2 uncharacterized protein Dana_GF21635 [Drosophila ananassae]
MYFKIFFEGGRTAGRVPLVRVRDGASIYDLKKLLEIRTKVPVKRQRMLLSHSKLSDDLMLSDVSRMCQISMQGNDPAWIELFDDTKPVCKLCYLEDIGCGSPEMSMEVDMDMDVELPLSSANESSTSCSSLADCNLTLRDDCSTGACCSTTEGSTASSTASTEDTSNASSSEEVAKEKKIRALRKKFCCPPLEVEEDQKCRDKCEIHCCKSYGRPPYANVLPEDRRYAVIIVNEEDPCNCDFKCILIFLAEQFQFSEDPNALIFSQCMPAVIFDCALMIVCDGSDTQEWLLRTARPMCPPFKCQSFLRHFELTRCSFVLPLIVKRTLCRMFRIIENQNCGLDTSKWCVMSQVTLDPCSKEYDRKVVYRGCQNVEITVYIDDESVAFLAKQCNKLKYMLWHLPVDFCTLAECM